MKKSARKYHFVGIGGIGMSALAQVLHARGFKVTGSEMVRSKTLVLLEKLGIPVFLGHDARNVRDADCVVWSSAIAPDNTEIIAARQAAIPLVHRAELLAQCTRDMRSVAVAGMHGKTTTTNMLFHVLRAGGLDPTLISGGIDVTLGSNAHVGDGDVVVMEADESDGSLVRFYPYSAVLTNLEEEHMGFYKNLDHIRSVFGQFASHVREPGCLAFCGDDKNLVSLTRVLGDSKIPFASYGFGSGCAVSAENVVMSSRGSTFQVLQNGRVRGSAELCVPGLHNVSNALAVITVGLRWGLTFEDICKGLAAFQGTLRRLECKGEIGGVRVLDDYAHHPTEIMASLRALSDHKEGRIFVVFQPHRYSRVHHMAEEFAQALGAADKIILTPIFSAGESNPHKVGAGWIVQKMRQDGHDAVCTGDDFMAIAADLATQVKAGDVVIGMGAGDIEKFAPLMKQALLAKAQTAMSAETMRC